MLNRKILFYFLILLSSSQILFANYGFYRKVANTCKYYRVEIDEKKMQLTKNTDGSYNFSIEMKSLRNNEKMTLVGSVRLALTYELGDAILLFWILKQQHRETKRTPN